MSDTLFADVSYFQKPIDRTYPYRFVMFRSNDGDFRDPSFDTNLRAVRRLMLWKRLIGFGIYYVYRPGGSGVGTLHAILSAYRSGWIGRWRMHRMFVVIDVESWRNSGLPTIQGSHSVAINAERERVIRLLNKHRLPMFRKARYAWDRKRVLVYGNSSDLAEIHPNRGDTLVGWANYSTNQGAPKGTVYHQFTSNATDVAPWAPSPVDLNSADGRAPEEFGAQIGVLPRRYLPKPANKGIA